jgi:hypothetical protein
VAHQVDLEEFIDDVLGSVEGLPDALVEILKAHMLQADSGRKIRLQKALREGIHAD